MRNQNSRNRKTANFMVTGLLVFMALVWLADQASAWLRKALG